MGLLERKGYQDRRDCPAPPVPGVAMVTKGRQVPPALSG
jgi:hypothetical protein